MTRRPLIRHNDYSPLDPPAVGAWEPSLTLSVVIPAYGGQHRLDLTLAALAAQTYPATLTEVIVVDDGTEPPLRLPALKPENTRMVRAPGDRRGAGHAMNAGIACAEGEVVQRLDADMVTHREHLESLLRWQHLTDYLVTYGGKKFVAEPVLRPGEVFETVAKGELESLFAGSDLISSSTEETIRRLDGLRASRNPYQTCTGPTVSLRRTLLDRVGGFDPEVLRGQDTEFAYRLAQEGAVFVPDLDARAVHLGLPAQRGEHRQDVVRLVETYLAQRVPLRRDLRKERGRGWAVPYVDVVYAADGEGVREAVAAALASTLSDVRVTLTGAWASLHGLQGVAPGHERFGLFVLREAFRRDPRVRLAADADASAAPIPFRFTGPAGHPLAPGTLEAMTKAMTEERLGMLIVRLPGGAAASLVRTEALNRARLLADAGDELDSVIEATHGVRHADAAEFWPSAREPAATEPAVSNPVQEAQPEPEPEPGSRLRRIIRRR
ncbi:glycosyltransferase [Streptosporangiaceae bacterium NEAU-GS5]|nr:glycosyltransferase [Streptosporangiaceae bacterium NEAU-GS5]